MLQRCSRPGTMLRVLADLVCHTRRDFGDGDTGTEEHRCYPFQE